ncbi:MAG: DUF1223 domain-containing protein [Rhizobacter sp.]|nr:DUF1223 domain-containing protein [Rhizobacter sp.]
MQHPLTRTGAALVLATASLALTAIARAAPAACHASSGATVPTIVELYTSEGCSSCPAADKWLASLKDTPGVVRLAFHVDYWDRLGWKDRFADPAYTKRQYEVSPKSGARFVYTPQVLVDGAEYRDWPALARRDARPATVTITLTQEGGTYLARLVRGPGAPQRLAAYWAVTEDGHVSDVKAGENDGVTLHHDAVVREYLPLPSVGAAPLRFEPKPAESPAAARRVLLVVTDADSGKPLQAAGC